MADWIDNLSGLPELKTKVGELLPFVCTPYRNDDPILFVDSEGSWQVIYDTNGNPCKYRCKIPW